MVANIFITAIRKTNPSSRPFCLHDRCPKKAIKRTVLSQFLEPTLPKKHRKANKLCGKWRCSVYFQTTSQKTNFFSVYKRNTTAQGRKERDVKRVSEDCFLTIRCNLTQTNCRRLRRKTKEWRWKWTQPLHLSSCNITHNDSYTNDGSQ